MLLMVVGTGVSASGPEAWLAHDKARPGQHEMITHIVQALQSGGHHLAAAPTGIGKTAAALAGCIHESRNSNSSAATIMFLTGRQSQHRIVVETVRAINNRLASGEHKVSLVDLIGQSHMCVQPFAKEHPALFSRLCSDMRAKRSCKPWLANAPSMSERILSHPLHVDELVELARHHSENGRSCQVCPWKAARESARAADVVVCDYNHLFNDNVRKATLDAMGLSLENLILVIDEAHNLPERIRRGLERRMTPEMVRNAAFEMEEYAGTNAEQNGLGSNDSIFWALEVLKVLRSKVVAFFRELNQRLNQSKTGAGVKSRDSKDKRTEMRIEISELLDVVKESIALVNQSGVQTKLGDVASSSNPTSLGLTDFAGLLAQVTIDVDDSDEEGEKELACTRLAAMLEVLIEWGKDAALVMRFESNNQSGTVSTHLLDAGVVSGPILKQVRGSVLMSGTLHPPSMYSDLLSVPSERKSEHSYDSPFLAKNRPVAIAEDVTTKYTGRGADNTNRIRSHIENLIASTTGHIAVFAPSYAQLNEYVKEHHWRVGRVIYEDSSWSKAQADDLLSELENERHSGRKVLVAGVFGGRLSEGIDYHDNLLSAVVCIGIPMAPPSVVSDALREYISERFGKGKSWQYASFQPAVNAVMQAMGRPIRAYGDKAFVLLLDNRFKQSNYRRCLPAELSPLFCSDSKATAVYAKRFFK